MSNGVPPMMNSFAVILSAVGVVSSVFSFLMNIYLMKKIRRNKKKDMILFYYRISVDVLLSALVTCFLTFVIVFSFFAKELAKYHGLIFYFSFPASNVGAARSIVTLCIAMERMIAAYIPIFFHNHRHFFPTVLILLFALAFGITEDIVLYGFCGFHLNMPHNCAALGCAVNTCFFDYWTSHKSTIFALNFGFSLLLCIKLFVINKLGKKTSVELSRANRLALIDVATVFLSDFLPSFLANQFSSTGFFSFENIGPYGAVAKMIGCAIEAASVFSTLKGKLRGSSVENSKSTGKVLMKTNGVRNY